jgi:predicted DNA-binding transcriptional regulator AlpA
MMLQEIQPDTVLTFREWCELVGVGGDQDRVIPVPEWAKLANISPKTARELIDRGDGPKVVQLSPNRIGIRICDHRAWLAARTRKKVAA